MERFLFSMSSHSLTSDVAGKMLSQWAEPPNRQIDTRASRGLFESEKCFTPSLLYNS